MIGQTLGHYKVLEKLGQGGMGEVYLAEDSTLERKVALKVLPHALAQDPERLHRFEREAKVLAALDHPNIVTIHSVEEADGVHFLTMQLVSGRTLSEMIPQGGLAVERIFDTAAPLADALAAAHDKGIIHRDLKPANVMVTDRGQIKVLDFGLAKVTREENPEDLTALPTEPFTEDGTILGTTPYMSPEQLEGKDLDSRTDVFSFGVTLYEMSTGERPFQGESAASVISAIMTSTPPPVDRTRPELPHHLARIIVHCLEKDPERRYQSIKDVRNEIEALRAEAQTQKSSTHVQPLPDVATSGSSVLEPATVARPRLWWVGLMAPVLAVSFALLFFFGRRDRIMPSVGGELSSPRSADVMPPVPPRKMLVVLPFENLGPPEDAYFADGMTEEITSRLAAVSGLGVISRTTAVQYDRTGKTLKGLGADLGVDYVLEGTVRWSHPDQGQSRVLITPQLIRVADDTHLWSDRFDRKLEDIFAVQAEVAQQVIGSLEVALLTPERHKVEAQPTQNMEAYQVYLRGIANMSRPGGGLDQDWVTATAMLERATQLDPGFALAHAWLAKARSSGNWFTAPEDPDWTAARAAAARAVELDPHLPEAHYALGMIHYWADRNYDLALHELSTAAAGRPSSTDILRGLGGVNRRLGQFEEALTAFRSAAVLDPRSSGAVLDYAQTLTLLRRYEEADAEFARSISLGPDQSGAYVDKAYNTILWKGDLSAARAILEQAPMELPGEWSHWYWFIQLWLERDFAALLRRVEEAGEFHCMACSSLYRRLYEAAAAEALGDAERATRAYEQAVTRLKEALTESPQIPGIHARLGEAYAGLGLKQEALREGLTAVELRPISHDAFHGPVMLEALAHIYVMVGEVDPALDLLDELLAIPSEFSAHWLRLDPSWDPIRQHPRFQKLLDTHTQEAEP